MPSSSSTRTLVMERCFSTLAHSPAMCPSSSIAVIRLSFSRNEIQRKHTHMRRTNEALIAVIGATGQQGGAVVRALQASSQFKVRALSRTPDKHGKLAEEVVKADLDRPETLNAAFEGAHGVFLVTNELKQATAAVRAAKGAGVKHFIWSTLPDVEAISGGKLDVPHFTVKAKIDRIVKEAGLRIIPSSSHL